MIAGALIFLGVVFLAIVVVVGFAFALSGRISREEQGVYYDDLVRRLRDAEAKRTAQAAEAAAPVHDTPRDLVVS
jgi:hypothetical protein